MTTEWRCRTSRAFVLGLAVLASGRPAAAEEAKALVPGSRVRIRTAEDRLVGRLVALRGETIVLARANGETLDIRRADVLGLEVSQRPSRKRYEAQGWGRSSGWAPPSPSALREARTASPPPGRTPG